MKKKEPNPFSFFQQSPGDPDDDIFGDYGSDLSKPKTPSTNSRETSKKDPKKDNPFSFFKMEDEPPPPISKKKDPFSVPFPENPTEEEEFFAPTKGTSKRDSFFDDPDLPFPTDSPKRQAQKLRDEPPLPTVDRKSEANQIEKYKKALEKAEAMTLGYEEKLKQANKTIEKMRQKEKEEAIEMEKAVNVIEVKLAETVARAEKAEYENERLVKTIKKLQSQGKGGGNHHQCTYDWQSLNEKTQFAVGSMNQIATQTETHINGLLTMTKEFELVLETLRSLGNISAVYGDPRDSA